MRKNKKLWDRIFLGFLIFWLIAIEVLTLAMLDPVYLGFITSIGVFFLPLITSIGIIIGLIYFFIMKFPVIQDVKNKLADVYKKGNIQKEHFDKIALGIDEAMNIQKKVEFEEEKEKINEKIELKEIKEDAKLEIIKRKNEVINNVVKKQIELTTDISNTDFDRKMSSY